MQFLPLKDAIKASTLSTHWRYQCLRRPNLLLDQSFFYSVSKFRRTILSEAGALEYLNIVCSILRCHVGPIQKFVLDVPHWMDRDFDFITPWIQILSGKFVQEFSLIQERRGFHRELPSYLFSRVRFDNLTHLTLINFTFPLVFDLPWDFPFLISLQMHVHIYMEPFPQQAEVFGLLTSKCPLLESLDLKVCALKSSLSIHAPKLQNLVLHGRLSKDMFGRSQTG